MKRWKDAVRNGVVSGAFASVLSTVVLAVCGRRETGSAFAPTNAISHWFWGEQAKRQDRPHPLYTIPGYLIHHASSTFWAILYERYAGHMLNRRSPALTLETAAAASAVACFVDYQLTPPRLQPGYEARLSKLSLTAVYVAFGLGLALGAHTVRNRDTN